MPIQTNIKKCAVTFILLFVSFGSFSQPFRYSSAIFNEVTIQKNIEYATAEWLANPISFLSQYNIHEGENLTEEKPLYMDLYMPQNDTLSKRPAIIFSHSGAFLLGSKENDDMVALCDSFTRKGYVTASISYRLGMGATVNRFFGIIIGLEISEKNAIRSVYRGIQDSRSAVRFLKKNAEIYGIDASKIYMVGSSAGAIQALHNIYLDKESEIPKEVNSEPALGNLDAVGIQGTNPNPAAVVSLWGALFDTEFIENKNIPLLLVHGEDDDIVPFKKGTPLKGIVQSNVLFQFSMPETYGSYCIDTALQNREFYPETYFVKGVKHEFYGVDTGEFPASGPNFYWDTINIKISDFLLKQFKPNASFSAEITGKSLSLTNSSTTNCFAEWDFGDGTKSYDWQPEHTYTLPGDYIIKLKVCNENAACDTVSANITASIPQIAELPEKNSLKLYPNPANSEITITGASYPFNVQIFDLTGKERISKILYQNKLDISSLSPGIYIIQINKGQDIFYQKFVKASPK